MGTITNEGARVLEVHDLRVVIRGVAVVDGVSFRMAAGGRTALVGASGSGKSLTAAAVLGALPVDAVASGSITLCGAEVLGVPTPRRPSAARPSVVWQDSAAALNPLVRVGTQVGEPLRRQLGSPAAARAAAGELLRDVGLDDPVQVLRRYPAELSGGQRQRVCLALALACRSPLLVADEPTTALDVVTQAEVVELLRRRTGEGAGPALLFICHELALAAALCSEVVVLDEGRVAQSGPVQELLDAPRTPGAARLVAAAREADSWAGTP